MRAREGARQRLLVNGQERRELASDRTRLLRHFLVADLERLGAERARGGDIASPRPGCPPGIRHRGELLGARLFDPEARRRPKREPRVVFPPHSHAQPAALEERADDVAPVADDVDELRLWEGEGERLRDEGRLRRVLDGPPAADEAEPTRRGEDPPNASCRLAGRKPRKLWNRRLERRDLAEVDEPRQRADRLPEKRRPRARTAENEDEPLVEWPQSFPNRAAACGDQPLYGSRVERRRSQRPAHAVIVPPSGVPGAVHAPG